MVHKTPDGSKLAVTGQLYDYGKADPLLAEVCLKTYHILLETRCLRAIEVSTICNETYTLINAVPSIYTEKKIISCSLPLWIVPLFCTGLIRYLYINY
jgi:hypothetical protein